MKYQDKYSQHSQHSPHPHTKRPWWWMAFSLLAFLAIGLVWEDVEAGFTWEYDTPADGNYWIEGYRLFEDDTLVATFPPEKREATNEESSVVPNATSVYTIAAFRGDESSPHSAPATFDITPPSNLRSVTTIVATTTIVIQSDGHQVVHSGQ